MSKRLNISSKFFTVGQPRHSSFSTINAWQYSNGDPLTGAKIAAEVYIDFLTRGEISVVSGVAVSEGKI